jgi:hypothetical protein
VTRLRRRLAREGGQALVELVACVPVLALVVLAIVQGLLVVGARGSAERALERGRVAAGLGRDPVAAARSGLASDARVRLEGRVLVVSLRPVRVLAGLPLPDAQARGTVELEVQSGRTIPTASRSTSAA